MPGRTPAETAACHPVDITSDSANRLGTRSSEGCSGAATRVPSASGMRISSDWQPSSRETLLIQVLTYTPTCTARKADQSGASRASLGENSNVPGAELKIPDREIALGEDVDHVSR
jgi:hypothetical protein